MYAMSTLSLPGLPGELNIFEIVGLVLPDECQARIVPLSLTENRPCTRESICYLLLFFFLNDPPRLPNAIHPEKKFI